jgi:hypothetical protein
MPKPRQGRRKIAGGRRRGRDKPPARAPHGHPEHADAHEHHHHEEGGAAAGVPGAEAPRVFRREGEARLVDGDGLVLGPVVLENPVHLLRLPHREHHADDDEQLEGAGEDVKPRVAHGEPAREDVPRAPGQELGQGHHQPDGHDDAEPGGHARRAFALGDGAALLLGEVLLKLVGGEAQRAVAVAHGLEEHHGAAQEGHLAGPLGHARHPRLLHEHDGLVAAAYGHGEAPGRAHHHALDDGLSADVGWLV